MGFVFTQTASDNFQRANEEPLNPANWTINSVSGGDLAIVSHLCVAEVALTTGTEYYTGVSFPENQYAKCTIDQFQSGNSVIELWILAALDESKGYELVLTANGDGTSSLELVSTPGGHTATGAPFIVAMGDTMAIGFIGSTVYAFYNGVQVLSLAADGSSTSGDPGLTIVFSSTQSDTSISLFSAGSISSGTQPITDIIQPGGGRIEAAARIESPHTSLIGTEFGTKVLG